MKLIREYVSNDDFREALDRPPGIIDPRSWAYWNSKMGRYPPPPLPMRHFGDDKGAGDIDRVGCGRNSNPNPSLRNDLEETRRAGREAWLKMRQLHPEETLKEIRRRAREDWLAQHGPEKD